MHPQVQRVLDQLQARADLNGDNKVDAKDLEIVRDRARQEAAQFVEKQTPLKALVIVAVSAFALGIVLTRAFWPGC